MPEGPEIRIMSDYINHVSQDKIFNKSYHVEKGNIPFEFDVRDYPYQNFNIKSDFHGKKLILYLESNTLRIPIYIFMGMSGSIKWVRTTEWEDTKYTRLKFDTIDGFSLLIYGGFLGPKYSISRNFKNSKIGPDIVKEYESFETLILHSLNNKLFDKPIFEVLLHQEYFAGIGNYLRSTILFYADVNPFESARNILKDNKPFLKLCREVLEKSYKLNGGQLKDWDNPFNKDSHEFDNWVYYQRGAKVQDSQKRTFWFDPKWLK